VFIVTGRKDNVVRVPTKMIRWREGKVGVLVNEGGKAAWRNLKLGMVGQESVEVAEGLAEPDMLIMTGEAQAKKLQPGRRVVTAP
jgi:hypothetical protein